MSEKLIVDNDRPEVAPNFCPPAAIDLSGERGKNVKTPNARFPRHLGAVNVSGRGDGCDRDRPPNFS